VTVLEVDRGFPSRVGIEWFGPFARTRSWQLVDELHFTASHPYVADALTHAAADFIQDPLLARLRSVWSLPFGAYAQLDPKRCRVGAFGAAPPAQDVERLVDALARLPSVKTWRLRGATPAMVGACLDSRLLDHVAFSARGNGWSLDWSG